ncbi:MAG: glycosyl transferase [Geobacteraceae bacterium GWC2_55_20]|nr:MAG: glycosyl transferase [Geobacteraceae bacterium GWC2_55_20]OGU25711.1 MAG: glycosyl transferase [Geobacteraceae bacterium GWF2_54_21]HCE68587.1 glycosyl transferase [Geobacter sp.]
MKSKEQKIAHYDSIAHERDGWRSRNSYYYKKLEGLLASLVPQGKKIIEIGCGTGELLAALKPSSGVGLDFSKSMIEIAHNRFPSLRFSCQDAENILENETFEYVIMSDLVGELTDVWVSFQELHKLTDASSRVVITYYNYLWEPVLRLAEKLGFRMPQDYQNWLSLDDIEHVLNLNDFEVIKKGCHTLIPVHIPLISNFVNKFASLVPVLKNLCLIQYIVAKQAPFISRDNIPNLKVSVIIPCRNEMGNIESAVERVPMMGAATELIFVDGESSDGTVEKIEEMILKYNNTKDIRLIHQTAPVSEGNPSGEHSLTPPNKMLKLGKGDAVRKGFEAATGDILMILDSDLTVPPEDLPKFYDAIASGKGEFINGTRLVYQMEKQAMRTLNLFGNMFFSKVFTWLLDQPIKDTLCGTKVLFKRDYENIKANRNYFGDFDPFGDFDLLFGAAKQNLKIVEVPIRYRMRTYGDIKIERFKHGLILLKMSLIGLRKLKLIS